MYGVTNEQTNARLFKINNKNTTTTYNLKT